MTKYPAPGRVKTRLARTLGPERACALQQAFVRDLAARLAGSGAELWWAVWPADAPLHELVPGARLVGQHGRDLGERMWHVWSVVSADGRYPTALLGADVPHVPLTSITRCDALLAEGADVVLGPVPDGGYYLIGLARPQPWLFDRVAWGTTTVLRDTLRQAHRRGSRVRLLPEAFDVDDAADVTALVALLEQDPAFLPHTRAVLCRREP